MDRLAIEQPINVFGHTAVTAEQPVITQHPQVTTLSDCLVRRLGHVVGIG